MDWDYKDDTFHNQWQSYRTRKSLDLDREDRHRIGVAMGTAYAGLQFGAQEYDTYKEKGIEAISPYMGIAIFTGAAGGPMAAFAPLIATPSTDSVAPPTFVSVTVCALLVVPAS